MVNIEQTIDEDVLKRTAVTFRSTQVEQTDGGLRVHGDLTMLGATHPIAFDVVAADGSLSATAVVKQTDFGMKPYSALFGALKVADEVEVTLAANLPRLIRPKSVGVHRLCVQAALDPRRQLAGAVRIQREVGDGAGLGGIAAIAGRPRAV